MGIDKDRSLLTDVVLRRQAEELLKANMAESDVPRRDDELHRLLHELQVHQIELEMQNAEIRQGRDELEKVLEKYTDLYDFAPVGYFILDRIGAVRAVNLSGASLLRIERVRLLGQPFGQFVKSESRPFFSRFLGEVFASRDKVSCEVALTTKKNLPLIVQVEAVAFGALQECRVAVIDSTERKMAEDALQQALSELKAANVELEAFNYSVSHDLRLPLTILNSYSQMLQELCGHKIDEKCRGYIQKIFDGTLQMNRLIDALLNFSQAGRSELHPDTVDLSNMAAKITMELKETDPRREVTFRIGEGIVVFGDSDLLRVVLDNVIGNAWKYAGNCEGAVIEFGVTEIDGTTAYFVKDNGPGFDMAHADRLFIPFLRLPGTKGEGHGIGLATVERIIRRHGGRIWAVGETGKSACFYFTLSADHVSIPHSRNNKTDPNPRAKSGISALTRSLANIATTSPVI
ncbi:MAG: ATP-binding protein [Desulfuromonadaceae bacterium]|nr:ATP-binding protein [Desulfuromonadaceae bacterium]